MPSSSRTSKSSSSSSSKKSSSSSGSRSKSMTLKLVPIAGILDWDDHGDESISQIVMACYDADSRSFQTVGKVRYDKKLMKELLQELCDYMRPNMDPSYDVTDEQTPMCDVWFDPVQVWEVKADLNDLGKSKKFSAAALKNGNVGIGFSKSVKFVRSRCDRDVDEATSSDKILEAFKKQ
mmetsp:Transcript_12977/g.19773  ORF Transcript_12977/g.19773 Transcript_12977/m.19773 type:complete len:179 (+) Transcript_12977:123-659(+)|eukprot:CAMPEP_0196807872 /NCGR_PEP_ID=MMETSP1362-20130617/7857_1 /TAXON_ID=163516 /ORGANISM="Leptocylindrus danicus, Strain CCMP1856" /LENGTH=178 /DNA_ID=CAMNT_0042181967 /DNA_START=96 /DNA_END=635 /DNA_ORIENTATION=+